MAPVKRNYLRIMPRFCLLLYPNIVPRCTSLMSENSRRLLQTRGTQDWSKSVYKHWPQSPNGTRSSLLLISEYLLLVAMIFIPSHLTTITRRRTSERVMRYVLDSNRRHAKFSARLLAKSRNSEEVCTGVVNVSTTQSGPKVKA